MNQRITAFCLALAFTPAGADTLEEVFQHPPESARPWVYWYWMQANATAEGITRDLEAMAEVGIGGAYLMPVGDAGEKTLANPPANPLSEHWWSLVVHSAREADRLGLRLAMNACDGWALAGGPWITPELSMQELVSTTRFLDGGKPFAGKLEQPTTREGYYRGLAVLAWPSPEGAGLTSARLEPEVTTNIPGLDPQALVEGATETINLRGEGWIQFAFDAPFTCRSIRLSPDQGLAYQLHRAEVQVSDDGSTFRSLGRLQPGEFHGWQDRGMDCTHAIPETTGRLFRLVLDRSGTPPPSENREGTKGRNRNRLAVRQIELSSEFRVHQWEGKAGYRWRRADWTTDAECPSAGCIPVDRILNLSDRMDADGVLRWSPPPGRWTVQRIGYTTTGETNNPAGAGRGLECDKFNSEAARVQFEGWFGETLKRVGPALAGRVLRRNHTDSWEARSQNWSPGFRDEFIRRRGNDPVPWLPAMSGVPVGSAELSERFLYDIRRTIADLVCDHFYGPLTRLGRERGAAFSAECIAPTMMADGLQHFRYADLPMGEFWLNSVNQDKPNDIMDAVCGGHIYGKRIIGAEAFTQNPLLWNTDPYHLKPMGDYNLAQGINQFFLHVWAHQAFDKRPGMTLNAVGTFFGRTQTWHQPGKAWLDYLRRSSALLQQGLPVADVCFFIGEEQPARSYLRHELPVPLSRGYAYDCLNRDALLTRARARNGRLVLPDGMSYRLLVLPPGDRMTPETASKIGALAEAGVPVIGPRPSRSISLSGYPDCDAEVRGIVETSWASVRSGATVDAVLEELGLPPDVEFPGVDLTPVFRETEEYFSPPLVWNHRRAGDADIYFLSNQERRTRTVDVAFRVAGRVPELWDAVTGKARDADTWRVEEQRTVVPMRFDPAGSMFVVFRRPGAPPDHHRPTVPPEEMPALKTIEGPWSVTFPPRRGAPERVELPELKSLSLHPDAGVRHFSGTATYACEFPLQESVPGDRLFLDLGGVANLAGITLNGSDLGVLWMPPFIVEVSGAVRAGKNTLKIEVTNTWRNRLIGDAGLPRKSAWAGLGTRIAGSTRRMPSTPRASWDP
ncbi:MAG: glycosyl hydrolase [Luteolibacter sp.]